MNGSLRFGCKADIVKLLLQHQSSSKEAQLLNIQVKVFDAAADVQSLVIPQSVKTFQAFKAQFWTHIKKQSINCCRVDIVFDRYVQNTLIHPARSKEDLLYC